MTAEITGGRKKPASSSRNKPQLPTAAQRALDEAAARQATAANHPRLGESGGPFGPEPTRFGDWERKGRAVDF